MGISSFTLPPKHKATTEKGNLQPVKIRRQPSLLCAALTRNAILALKNHMDRTAVMNSKVANKVKEVAGTGMVLKGPSAIANNQDSEAHPVTAYDVLAPFPDERPPRSHCILVKSHDHRDGGVVYEIRDDETFEVIYADYASRVDLKTEDIILRKNDIHVAPTATAAQMRISNLDVIYVTSVVPGRNLNTRWKNFYVRNTCNPPLEVMVQAKKTTRMRKVFERWGARINRDPARITMMHQDTKLSRMDRVMDTAIKNLDVVTAFPSPQ